MGRPERDVTTIRVTLEGEAGCHVEHLPSGARLEVRAPPEYGGPGGAVHRSLAGEVVVRFEPGETGES